MPDPATVLALALAGAPASPAIEDPSGRALDRFFAALARSDAGEPGALTRVMHVGDSSIGLDGLPHALRRRMQARFGDGGAGFVMLDRESDNYRNNAALLDAQGWHVCYVAYKCDPSGHYGYGGHVFRGRPGARTTIRTRTRGSTGRTLARVELWYGADPRGGELEIQIDDEMRQVFDTRADSRLDRWHGWQLVPGPHRLTIRDRGTGRPRVYGVVLETDGPGVVWDTISMIGAFARRVLELDREHLAAQVRRRRPDLVVFGFGGNDLRRMVVGGLAGPEFTAEYRKVIAHVRGGQDLACLVVSINDHAEAGDVAIGHRHNREMVAAQRAAALAEGCGFFDVIAAMGGPGSIRQWRRHDPPWAEPDLQHLSMAGRDRLGELIFAAIVARYDTWRARPRADDDGVR